MIKMPKISVVMPTYNAEKYLKEAMDSVLSQTFSDFEFLIVDDNSTDATRSIINSYNDERIKLIEGECKGIAAALNKGIKAACGEYIARMDADDISLPERFETQVSFMDKHVDTGVCGTVTYKFGEEVDSIVEQLPENDVDIKTNLLFNVPLIHPTVMFRKSVLHEDSILYDQDYFCAEDYDLFLRLIPYTKFYNIQEPLVKRRIHGTNASFITKEKGSILFLKSLKTCYNVLLGVDIDEKILPVFYLYGEDIEPFSKEDLKLLKQTFKEIIRKTNKSNIFNIEIVKENLTGKFNYFLEKSFEHKLIDKKFLKRMRMSNIKITPKNLVLLLFRELKRPFKRIHV